MPKLTRLFEPGRIGKMELKNRLIMGPMVTNAGNEEGYVDDKMIDCYVVRAKGGVGLIIVGASAISPDTPGFTKYWLNIYDDKFIPRLRDLARAVQANGAKAALQIWHGGPCLGSLGHPELAVGPSAVPIFAYGVMGPVPRVLTTEDIKKIIRDFAEAGRRVKEAGFDAVELHGGGHYILSAFQSPYTNKRTDEYGGTPEKRARFGCEVIAAVREKVGPDFPIILRMNGKDFLEGGLTIEEAAIQAPLFVKAGASALDVRDGLGFPPENEPGFTIPAAAAVKKAVSVPVFAGGKTDAALGEKTLAEGKADFIVIARGFLTDPELPKKVRGGRLGEVRGCTNCGGCTMDLMTDEHIHCLANAALGRESELAYERTSSPRRVMVVGGGLAGMEAARVLAERGHQVSLYERSSRLGGQWNIVTLEPGKNDFAVLTDYLSHRLKKLGVNVMKNKEVTPALVKETDPDVVVIATGARPIVPDIPGIKRKNVVLANDAITSEASVGKTVAIIGARMTGLEVAVDLAEKGRKVSLIDQYEIAQGLSPAETGALMARLKKAGAQMYPNSRVLEIKEDGVSISKEGKARFIPADTVVLAAGLKPENSLAAQLSGITAMVYSIGDCVEPRRGREAVLEGLKIGREV